MIASCPSLRTGDGFLSTTFAHLDCQAQTIGSFGYQALAVSGSPTGLLLTGILTLFIAVLGYKMILGERIGVDVLIISTLKIAFLLGLATSWPLYKTAVYDVVLRGPAELASSIGGAANLPGSDGDMITRLQNVDEALMSLNTAGTGRTDASITQVTGHKAQPIGDGFALGLGKTVFAAGILGSMGTLRLAGGILLALAPFFAGFLLFEASRSFFSGWLRALCAVALGSLVTALVLGVELAIIEPWLAEVLALRAARVATLDAPFEFLALALCFSFIFLGALAICTRLCFASSPINWIKVQVERAIPALSQAVRGGTHGDLAFAGVPANGVDRASIIARSVSDNVRREEQTLQLQVSGADASIHAGTGRSNMPASRDADTQVSVTVNSGLGQSYRRNSRRSSTSSDNRSLR